MTNTLKMKIQKMSGARRSICDRQYPRLQGVSTHQQRRHVQLGLRGSNANHAGKDGQPRKKQQHVKQSHSGFAHPSSCCGGCQSRVLGSSSAGVGGDRVASSSLPPGSARWAERPMRTSMLSSVQTFLSAQPCRQEWPHPILHRQN